MLKRRRTRLLLLGVLSVAGALLIAVGLARDDGDADPRTGTPLDIQWAGDSGYARLGEGQVVRLRVDDDKVSLEVLADDLEFPRGVAVIGETLYVAELGPLPCENPVPRCKGEHVSHSTAEGELEILQSSNGRILALAIEGDGLGEPTVLVDGLPFVNTDHGLNDLDAGPDGQLYLSIGNLDELAWNDGGDSPDPADTELLGTILRIDPATGEQKVFVSGLRNVFGLDFDEAGTLWGVDNDGRGRGVWRFEELLRMEEGADYGFPDDGTVGPYQRRTGFASWIMPTGAGSSGLRVRDDVVLSGDCGRLTRVTLRSEGGDASETQASRRGCVTAVEELPDGRLILGAVLGEEAFAVTTESELFGS